MLPIRGGWLAASVQGAKPSFEASHISLNACLLAWRKGLPLFAKGLIDNRSDLSLQHLG